MCVTINILSTILKSVVNNKTRDEFANEFIGISIDGISEKGINMISDYIDKEKSKLNYILSKENMKSLNIPEENVDYVVAEVKYILSKVKITDEVFRQCKYNSMELRDYLLEKYLEYKDDYIECESDIKKVLFTVADALIKLIRESESFEKDFLIHISNSVDDANEEIQKISNYIQENFDKLEVNNQEILGILYSILKQIQSLNMQNKKQTVKSRTQEYADKWNANMFLNDFDKRDENAGVNVKLSEVYLEDYLPHYIWGENEKTSCDLKTLLSDYIDKMIGNNMLLILGQPGIGKSTLITWITANYTSRVDDIMVYQFAADLKDMDWGNRNISEKILEKLGLSYNDLNGRTLILDGFDEVFVGSDRKEILDNIYWDLIKGRIVEKFSLIITCRENYIKGFERIQCKYITLQPWDEEQIKSFYTLFKAKTKGTISEHTISSVIKSKEILGIPLILYMVLALNITIEEEGSNVDIYDKIFSLEGGIYDRCIENKNFAGTHRISEIKKQIHQISRDIAIWMFENEPYEACISQEEYKKISITVTKEGAKENEDMQQDVLIGNFFKLLRHCEGIETEKLYFVHRSIYEYFVAETIYSSIENSMKEFTNESQEELAGNLAFYLKKGEITYTIGEYLHNKIIKFYNNLDIYKRQNFYLWWETALDKMMKVGMFYYTKKYIQDYENIMAKEVNCFLNMIKILRLLLHISNKKYILERVNGYELDRYIKHCIVECEDINLSYFFLQDADLMDINLNRANLKRANLERANLKGAKLFEVDLGGANLSGADLSGADLKNCLLQQFYLTENNEVQFTNAVNLKGANLTGTIIDDIQIPFLEKCDININDIKVYIKETEEIISYKEYCIRNND